MRKSFWSVLAEERFIKKVLVATSLTVALTGLAIVPSAKADSFVYNVTADGGGVHLDVTFDLPSFENPANGISTFVSGSTVDGQTAIGFGISGNSSGCDDGLGDSISTGPCWVGRNNMHNSESTGVSPSFSGLGTFTATDFGITTTVTITEVVGAPEPSSLALMLLGVGLVFVLRKRNSRGHQLAT